MNDCLNVKHNLPFALTTLCYSMQQVMEAFKKKPALGDNPIGRLVDLPVTVTNNTLTFHILNNDLAAFAVLDKNYQDKRKTAEEQMSISEEKQKV